MPKSYQDWRQLERLNNFPSVIAIGGSERAFVEKALVEIKSKVLSTGPVDFNFDEISGKNKTLEEVLASAQNLPIMSDRRLVLVTESDSLKTDELKAFEDYLEDPNTASILVFVFSQIDSRLKFQKLLDQAGFLYKFEHPRDHEMPQIIQAKVKERSLSISYDAAEHLHLEIGSNLLMLERALEKLELAAEDSKIDAKLIDEQVAQTAFQDAFELARSVVLKDKKKTVKALGQLRDAREVPLKLVGVLAWQFRIILKVRAMLDERVSAREIGSKLRLFGDRLDFVLKAAKSMETSEQIKRIESLFSLDRALKSSRSPAWLVFEEAVFDLIR